jgi:cystathionine beta-lyase/cystathionine gamma-synthase
MLGSVIGNMEGWLAVRSVRTLEVRVQRQSKTAEELVRWLDALLNGDDEQGAAVRKTVATIQHASLQARDADTNAWLSKQMPNGYGPVFAITLQSPELARRLPSLLRFFEHATSLGGVESLIEWRAMTDKTVDRRLLRLSIGLEDVDDLKADLLQAFAKLA